MDYIANGLGSADRRLLSYGVMEGIKLDLNRYSTIMVKTNDMEWFFERLSGFGEIEFIVNVKM